MALISKIRNNNLLIIILLGGALAAFVLMDMFSGNKGPGGGNPMDVGSINGQPISWMKFQRTENTIYRGSSADTYSRRAALWNYFVEESLVNDISEDMGLHVGKEELLDLQFGSNLSPIIRNNFSDPRTRQVNREQLNQFKAQIESGSMASGLRQYWKIQEDQIVKDKLQSKLSAMVSKGLYSPNWMLEETYKAKNSNIAFNYVKIPFDDVDGSSITVSDDDIKNYLDNNMSLYETKKETRKIDYIVFDVKPTKGDSVAIFEEMKEQLVSFRNTEDVANYVESQTGRFVNQYKKLEELNDIVQNSFTDQEVGAMAGPYLDGNNYQIARLVEKRMVADSAKSRHILILAKTEAEFVAAEKTIDSIKTLILSGKASFDSLAIKYSQDPGSASKGGEYDYVDVNQFVPEFRDVIFFNGSKGNYYTVRTSYGVHLIEPLGTKGEKKEMVVVAFVDTPIIPSDQTQGNIRAEVVDLLTENTSFEAMKSAVANKPNVRIESSNYFSDDNFSIGNLGGGQGARDIVRFAFNTDNIGTLSPEIFSFADKVNFYDKNYVVAALKEIRPAGKPSVSSVKSLIEPKVKNIKKANYLNGLVSGMSLEDVASKYQTTVDTIQGTNFDSKYVAGLGSEPEVISKAFSLSPGTVSEVISGANGLYLINVTRPATPVTIPTNISALRKQFQTPNNQLPSSLVNAIKEYSDIEDNRFTFY